MLEYRKFLSHGFNSDAGSTYHSYGFMAAGVVFIRGVYEHSNWFQQDTLRPSLENVRINLNGSGCRNPGEIHAWQAMDFKTINVTYDQKSSGEAFTVNVDIEYATGVEEARVHETEQGILRGLAE